MSDPRITWGVFRDVAKAQSCTESMEVDRIGEVSYKWIMLRRQYGDDLRFVPIPDGCDGEKIEWITLRVVAVKLGIPFSAFGPVAADYLAKFGEIN